MQKNLTILLIFAGLFAGSALAAMPEADAHAPTKIKATTISETQIEIYWTHTLESGTEGHEDSGATKNYTQVDVDIIRLAEGGTAVNIVNNSTGGFTGAVVDIKAGEETCTTEANTGGMCVWTDNVAQGENYTYTVCHGDSGSSADPSTLTETDCSVDTTNSALGTTVHNSTKASAIGKDSINLSAEERSVFVTWNGCFGNSSSSCTSNQSHPTLYGNHTGVGGLKIEYSSDGGSTYSTATSNSSIRGAANTYEVTGLEAGTQYWFKFSGIQEGNNIQDQLAGTVDLAISGINTITTTDAGGETVESSPLASSYATGAVTDGNLKVTLSEDKGWDRILNVVLHTNINSGDAITDSDTSITWNYFNGVTVIDPNNYFKNVNVVAEQSGVRTMDLTYEISWNKSLPRANVILETSDFPGNVGTTTIASAWTSFPATQVDFEVPEASNNGEVMALWADGAMNHAFLTNDVDYEVLGDIQYFVSDEIIDISQDATVVLDEEEGVVQLFESITLSKDYVKIGAKYSKTLVITGTLKGEFFGGGEPVMFTVSNPDGSESQLSAVTTSARTFQIPIIIDEFESGVYQFNPSHNDHIGEPLLFSHNYFE